MVNEPSVFEPSRFDCSCFYVFWLAMFCDFITSGTSSILFEPVHDKTNQMASAHSEDSDQPGHLPSLIRVFAADSMGS